ncbi:hypothetical protein ACSSS7_001467 [Eimeria intestinalis]
MASTLILFTAASLALLDSATAAASEDRTLKVGSNSFCLFAMTEAREAVGLGQVASSLELIPDIYQIEKPTGVWENVCDTLLDGKPFKPTTDPKGTYALFGLGEAGQDSQEMELTASQCSAAVQSWQKGFSQFNADPPTKNKFDYVSASPEQVSFVTLYNPSPGGTGECAVATCKSTPTSRAGKTRTVSGLVCMTSPNGFDNTPLFTEAQWKNIRKAFSSSASTAMPSLVALGVVVLAAGLLP